MYTDSFAQISEQRLLDELVQETIKFNGIDIIYCPREYVAFDSLYGEDVLSAFNNSFEIEAYVVDVDAFTGEGDLVAKFGLEIRDQVELEISQSRFQAITGLEKPAEGDLIHFPLSNGLFEILFTEDESPFYPLGTLHVFKLTLQLFEYSQEDLNTGIPDIDVVEIEYENKDDPSNDPFSGNEIVQDEAFSVIDFSETDPFSEGNY